MALPAFNMRQLLEAGCHFGHQSHRWNPKMAPFIFGSRNNIHIIDLAQSVPLLHQALVKVSDVVANAHTKARGAVIEVDYPGIGPVKSAANPIRLSDAPVQMRRKSPGIGEHTVEIMQEVGYSDAEIAALRDANAIGLP